MEFKDILKQLLLNKNCTQRDLAKYVGVKPNTVCDWLKKGTSPKINHIHMIAKFFNISYDYLFTGTLNTVSDLSDDEKKLISLYRNLSNNDKYRELGRLELLNEQQEQANNMEKNVG